MAEIYVSIGSNIDREANIRGGIQALAEKFSAVSLSPVYESVSVGFEGDNFYNLAARFETDKSIEELNDTLDQIEDQYGRDRSGPRFSSRTLDIDLLLYDDVIEQSGCVLPRPEIYENAFVLKPLADIAADHVDPLKHKTYRQLWEEFKPGERQSLWQVELDLETVNS